MIQFLLAAPNSGSGKTTLACALLAALKNRGYAPCAFKCGPDYIDPMFHRAVLGVESHNLDLFFSSPETARGLYASGAAGHGAAVCEGAMGFYDGLSGTSTTASAWQVADTLNLPVLLVVRPKGASLTLAAQIKGLQSFRTPSHLAGILLNDCKPGLYKMLAPMLEAETGLPVAGFLPPVPEAAIGSRHLGLYTAGEVADLQQKIALLAQAAEETIHWEKLLSLCEQPAPAAAQIKQEHKKQCVKIAVARDEAFCFAYAETLEALTAAGAEIVPFSPVRDPALPEGAGGLYLPGGYPELYAQALSENTSMRQSIRGAVAAGLPTVAECGGFLLLHKTLTGVPMADICGGTAQMGSRLKQFGYITLTANSDSLLCRQGETLTAHEFHYAQSTQPGADFSAQKPLRTRGWQCIHASDTLHAGYPHIHFAGNVPAAQRFLHRCQTYHQEAKR